MRKNINKLLSFIIIILVLGGCANKQVEPTGLKEYTSQELKLDGVFLDACTQKQLGNLDRALELYDEVISIDPKYAAAYFDKASIMYNKKNLKSAIELTQKAINLQPRNIWYRLQLGGADCLRIPG